MINYRQRNYVFYFVADESRLFYTKILDGCCNERVFAMVYSKYKLNIMVCKDSLLIGAENG
jgi:hypothetical protein